MKNKRTIANKETKFPKRTHFKRASFGQFRVPKLKKVYYFGKIRMMLFMFMKIKGTDFLIQGQITPKVWLR